MKKLFNKEKWKFILLLPIICILLSNCSRYENEPDYNPILSKPNLNKVSFNIKIPDINNSNKTADELFILYKNAVFDKGLGLPSNYNILLTLLDDNKQNTNIKYRLNGEWNKSVFYIQPGTYKVTGTSYPKSNIGCLYINPGPETSNPQTIFQDGYSDKPYFKFNSIITIKNDNIITLNPIWDCFFILGTTGPIKKININGHNLINYKRIENNVDAIIYDHYIPLFYNQEFNSSKETIQKLNITLNLIGIGATSGNTYTLEGRWLENKKFNIVPGTYNITGTCGPGLSQIKSYLAVQLVSGGTITYNPGYSKYASFNFNTGNDNINITGGTTILLKPSWDCYLIMSKYSAATPQVKIFGYGGTTSSTSEIIVESVKGSNGTYFPMFFTTTLTKKNMAWEISEIRLLDNASALVKSVNMYDKTPQYQLKYFYNLSGPNDFGIDLGTLIDLQTE